MSSFDATSPPLMRLSLFKVVALKVKQRTQREENSPPAAQ